MPDLLIALLLLISYTETMEIDCLIPAAGFSSRMGKWKPMLPYKNKTIIETVVENAFSLCSRVILVTGYKGTELEKLYRDNKNVIPVRNNNFERGMFSSIQTGMPLIQADWFFITMGDMPEIKKPLYTTLLCTLETNPSIDIVRPLFNGKRGHPVLLKKNVVQTILSEPADSEMKNVFTHHRVLELPLDLPESFKDIDTEEDYKKQLYN